MGVFVLKVYKDPVIYGDFIKAENDLIYHKVTESDAEHFVRVGYHVTQKGEGIKTFGEANNCLNCPELFLKTMMVMSYEGVTLAKYLSGIRVRSFLNSMVQILEGVVHLHSKCIVHLDLHAQNVFLNDPHSERGKATIGDLGMSKKVSSPNRFTTDEFTAPEKAEHLPPEWKLNSKEEMDLRKIDAYSVGCLIKEFFESETKIGDDTRKNVLKSVGEKLRKEWRVRMTCVEALKELRKANGMYM